MPPKKTKGRILLIDDEHLIVAVLCRSLKKEGYEICGETETDNIISKICAYNPDIVLLDIKMPGRNGMDILQEIKRKGIETQVVMLTSDDSVETAVKAMKLGASDYLTKPFDTDELKIALGNLIQKMKPKPVVPSPAPL